MATERPSIEQTKQFVESGRRLMEKHPDINEKLLEADRDGLTISPEAVHELIRLGRPDIAYYLARPENREHALKLHNLPPHAQVAEVGSIGRQLDESGSMNQPEMDGDAGYLAQRKERRAKAGYR